jgi:hypothetical protein
MVTSWAGPGHRKPAAPPRHMAARKESGTHSMARPPSWAAQAPTTIIASRGSTPLKGCARAGGKARPRLDEHVGGGRPGRDHDDGAGERRS